MSRRYTYETTLSFGTDGEPTYAEVDVKVSYTIAWGSPEVGRGYMADPAGYDPGAPDVVEDVNLITVNGQPRPWGMGWGYISDAEFETMVTEKLEAEHERMIEEAVEHEAAARDSYLEDLAEERRLDARGDQ